VYWLLAGRRRAPVFFLLLASYYFYALWNPWCLVFLVLISAVDFGSALAIAWTSRPIVRRLFVLVSVVIDVGCLLVFKYFNFFSTSAAELLSKLGRPTSPLVLRLVLPLGALFHYLSLARLCHRRLSRHDEADTPAARVLHLRRILSHLDRRADRARG